MATTVILPKVDMDQETGKIVEWLKREGDQVEKGEPILVIETDKVAIDVKSPASGFLRGIRAKPDEVIPIGTIIAYILNPGEKLPDESKSPEPPVQTQPVTTSSTSTESNTTPVALNIAASHNIDLASIEGTGPRGIVTKQDVQTRLDMISGESATEGKVYATPAARQLARKRGVNLENITGSGPGDRIQAADVLAAPVAVPESKPRSEIKVLPMQGIRRTIADRMTASYQSTPHITFTTRVDISRFEQARERLNTKAEAANQSRVSVTRLSPKLFHWL